jgi:hypothetical protein
MGNASSSPLGEPDEHSPPVHPKRVMSSGLDKRIGSIREIDSNRVTPSQLASQVISN